MHSSDSPLDRTDRSKAGFTLAELLIVILIVVLLLALFLPAIGAARSASRKVQCLNNMKQIAISLQNYHDTEGSFPPGWSANKIGAPGWGWATRTLDYAEQRMLSDSIDYSESLITLVNRSAIDRSLTTFKCPGDRGVWDEPVVITLKGGQKIKLGISSFVGNFGSRSFEKCDPLNPSEACLGDGVFYRNSYIHLADIQDGASNTMLISERRAGKLTGVWPGVVPGTKNGIGRIVGHAGVTPNDETTELGFSSNHYRGVNASFGDGAVRFVPDTIDPAVFRALSTISGKELHIDYEPQP